MVDRNKKLELLENLNNEINLERQRKNLIEKNKEQKFEKANLQKALNTLYKEMRSLHVNSEFLKDFDKLMDKEDKIRRMINDDPSLKVSKKKGNIKVRSVFENEKLMVELRVIV